MTNKFDYIIVGQGLAGTCLAFQLLDRNKKVLVIDELRKNTSSKVAAGLYNPVTGRKMVLTWKANLLFPYLHEFYTKLEQKLKTNFLHQKTIYRPFLSLKEQNEWMGKSSLQEYTSFIENVHTKSPYVNHLHDEFGGLALKNSGYLDIPAFLQKSRKYFDEHNMLVSDLFDDNQLTVSDNNISYKNYSANKIIFCRGTDDLTNSYFNWLPFNHVKGEILEIIPEEQIETIYNRGVFIMPRDNNKCIAGATYENKDLTLNITDKGRDALITKMEMILKLKYTIVNQRAGVRPATKDRRPFAGLHPEQKAVGIFNGLGTKGVTLAPYFSGQFADYLTDKKDVDREVDVNRYYSLYYHK